MAARVVTQSAGETEVLMRGFDPAFLRRQAARECERLLGPTWRFTEEQITPCMVSLGGRVRLYEGRFRASRSVSRFSTRSTSRSRASSRASQQYVAIAVHYDAQTLPQLAAHFYRQALEERNHAMMIVQYLLDAEPVTTPAVAAPQTTFADDREPVALALAQEKTVTEQIAGSSARARGRRARR